MVPAAVAPGALSEEDKDINKKFVLSAVGMIAVLGTLGLGVGSKLGQMWVRSFVVSLDDEKVAIKKPGLLARLFSPPDLGPNAPAVTTTTAGSAASTSATASVSASAATTAAPQPSAATAAAYGNFRRKPVPGAPASVSVPAAATPATTMMIAAANATAAAPAAPAYPAAMGPALPPTGAAAAAASATAAPAVASAPRAMGPAAAAAAAAIARAASSSTAAAATAPAAPVAVAAANTATAAAVAAGAAAGGGGGGGGAPMWLSSTPPAHTLTYRRLPEGPLKTSVQVRSIGAIFALFAVFYG